VKNSNSKWRGGLCGASLVAIFFFVPPLAAQITVEGVTDKTVYTDQATFRVVTAAGWNYTVTLNGETKPAGVSVAVVGANYYELAVSRRNTTSGAVENLLVQFIIKSSERRDAEWGLPPWVPYPRIPSASGEYAGAHLRVVAPPAFPAGIEIPVFAWVEDDAGKRVGVHGALKSDGLPDLKLFRGVGSVLLPAATAGSTVLWSPSVYSLSVPKTIVIDASTSWTTASGSISSSRDWGENARIRVTANLTVAAAATLTIGAGTVVQIAPGANIEVSGKILVNGTVDRPVIFTPSSRAQPWGGFLFRASTSVADMKYAVKTGACADPDWFDDNAPDDETHLPNQPLIYLSNGAHVTLTDCYLFDCHGQAGHGEDSYLTLNRSVYQKFLTGGEYNGGSVTLNGSAVIEFPDEDAPFADDDGDAIYFTGGAHSVTDTLIGWAHDDGTDAGSGSGGTVTITRCWYESDYHEGMAWSSGSGTRNATATDTVAMNCGQGFESGWGDAEATANHCLLLGNCTGARFGDNYDWDYNGYLHVSNSVVLHNYRDVWGRTWDDWEVRLSQMVIQGNHLTAADPLFPTNTPWDPALHAALLEPFLPTPAAVVGVGIATRKEKFDLTELAGGVPVRLSTFTTSVVSVDYAVDSETDSLASGTLRFDPGETVKKIDLSDPAFASHDLVRVTISHPSSAELTGIGSVTFRRTVQVTLLPAGSTWKYFDKGIDQGTAWREPGFADGAWASGKAELGYGDGGESTVVSYGPDSDNKYPTTYFRARFTIGDPAAFDGLTVRLKRDDGAVVYLNGQEVFRSNMPSGTATYSTWTGNTASDDGDSFVVGEIPTSALTAGTNVVAVEVHQADAGSSDVSFDLELLGTSTAATVPVFVRGDANDDGVVDISDALRILFVQFAGATTDCRDSLDADDNGQLTVTDAIRVLDYLFRSGSAIAAPFPTAGEDPTSDDLDCAP